MPVYGSVRVEPVVVEAVFEVVAGLFDATVVGVGDGLDGGLEEIVLVELGAAATVVVDAVVLELANGSVYC